MNLLVLHCRRVSARIHQPRSDTDRNHDSKYRQLLPLTLFEKAEEYRDDNADTDRTNEDRRRAK